MKAAIFNPYWDTLGGGERYAISFAKVLFEKGYQTDIEWKDPSILRKIENRFGIKTQGINVKDNIKKGEGYDLCFWISDGSIPLLHSRNNILHFQVPFTNVNGDSLLNKMKLFRIKKVVCNSNFTKKVIDKEFRVFSQVIYPPCDTTKIKPKRKENIILSVGRFSQLLQSKHQDVLVETFIKLCKRGLNDWKLILAGGTDVGGSEYLNDLKLKAKAYPIEFVDNPDYKMIVDLYGRAKIFWSASGYGVNEEKYPEKVEHFGITLIEAAAAGCVPLVCNAGGYPEILENDDQFLWRKKYELIRKTNYLVRNSHELKMISKTVEKLSNTFDYVRFKNAVSALL